MTAPPSGSPPASVEAGRVGPLEPTDPVERAVVLEAEVAGGMLLVDPARVRAHGLNASAAAVWRATAGGTSVADVVEQVAVAFDLPAASVAADVHRALAELAAEGLLELGAAGAPAAPADATPQPTTSERPEAGTTDELVDRTGGPDEDGAGTEPIGPFRGFDLAFDLVAADPVVRDALAEVWAPLAMPVGAPAPEGVRRYRISSGDGSSDDRGAGTWSLTLDGEPVARAGSPAAMVAHAVWHANQLVSTATMRYLRLHAAGVLVDGGAVLLPAAMNSGKSTLTTALVQGGAGYLTDETVAIDLDTAGVVPYPKAITLDPGSWSHFAGLEPPFLTATPELAHGKWYVHPDAVRAGSALVPTTTASGTVAADVAVHAVVLIAHDPTRPTRLDRLAPVDAAAALARNAFNLVEVGQGGVDVIARLATTVPCWSLSAADIESGAGAIVDAARTAREEARRFSPGAAAPST